MRTLHIFLPIILIMAPKLIGFFYNPLWRYIYLFILFTDVCLHEVIPYVQYLHVSDCNDSSFGYSYIQYKGSTDEINTCTPHTDDMRTHD